MQKLGLLCVLFLCSGLVVSVLGHSWLDCADWRFNNPNNKQFMDDDGTCHGYARKYPAGSRAYGTYDGFQWYRHYVQNPNWKTNPAQSLSDSASVSRPYNPNDGSDERRQNPVSAAYYPNSEHGSTFGPMTQTRAGDSLCFRWPAKNHAGHVNDQNMVFIYWAPNPNTADPSQITMLQNEVARLRYRNCPEPGVPSSGDQTGSGSDRMPCGGCFTVPSKSPGIYLVQWRWMLNQGEWYSSCADIEILAGSTPTPGPSPAPGPDPNGGGDGDIKISASITVRIPRAPGDLDIALFVAEIASVLDIPVDAIDEVEVQLDQSTDNPPSTVIIFVITNAQGTDPVAKARQLKAMAEDQDPRLASTQSLQGLEVLSVEQTSSVGRILDFTSFVLMAFLVFAPFFF